MSPLHAAPGHEYDTEDGPDLVEVYRLRSQARERIELLLGPDTSSQAAIEAYHHERANWKHWDRWLPGAAPVERLAIELGRA